MAGERNGDRLVRAYRRLLWAYPWEYRRVRGVEMLTTLLDAAAPGQRRPSARDVLDLLVGGLRCRLRVPAAPAYLLVAATAALVVAVAGAWLGGLAGWHAGTSLPTQAEVMAAATVAVPDAAKYLPARTKHCDRHCWANPSDALIVYDDPFQDDDAFPPLADSERPRDARPATNRVYLPLTVPHAEMATIAAQAHDRLVAAGWNASPVHPYVDMRWFWATKGDLTLRFEGRGTTQPDYPAVAIIVHHDAPPATLPAAAASGAVGLLIGWLLAAFAIRRYLVHRKVVRTTMLATGPPALIIVGLNAGTTLLSSLSALFGGGLGAAQAALLGMPVMQAPMVGVVSVSLLASLAVALMPAPAVSSPPSDPHPTSA